ncbi:hypothetical protein FSP39_004018 [Pinctada imbricata]|uniref:Uracil-DNA glycosylase n=1 Tax=Pinctada imbricata TaxID=66713 RepID=A0AA88YUN3_PINIB|nr:hypothetical protein FSP39_004018 [Pinctada imbricata]
MPPKRKASATSSASQAKKAKTEKETKVKNKVKSKEKTKSIDSDATKSEAPSTADTGALNLSSLLTDAAWKKALDAEFKLPYFKELEKQLAADYSKGEQIFPPKNLIFNAFNKTPFDKVKVVLLGQDPYHDDGQAMGLSFSVPVGIPPPPSLKNIYKELTTDKDIKNFTPPSHGCLEKWSEQGILLLNATLTVKAHQPNSHAKYGWQKFTDAVIKHISENSKERVVFLLWGGFAHKKEKLINKDRHSIIKTAHPSPLSCTKFFGCKCFSKVNEELKKLKRTAVDWSL